ncbi:MAG TPA: M61 family peptidase [Thermoanaerobaculia bacterium]|nr:M61 family peptidase [Thermoanaerobaculia bacterium]
MRRLAILLLALLPQFARAADETTVFVDATDARKGVFHSTLTMSAAGGTTVTLVFPKWIPGEHSPTGPLMQMAGLHVRANGVEVPWRRDPVDVFAIDVDIPRGDSNTLELRFDYLSPPEGFGGGYGESANATPHLLVVLWNQLVFYCAGVPTDDLPFRASLKLPHDWKFATALHTSREENGIVQFDTVSLTTLIDSPVLAGEYFRMVPVTDKVAIAIAADSRAALAITDAQTTTLRNFIAETNALFGAQHYRHYTWLVGLSDLLEINGLEHHESSDNRMAERGLIDSAHATRLLSTLIHELVHSWNGKYRRPAGLATRDYQQPMQGELLWVYEGMTRYLGNFVLASRAGTYSPQMTRDYVAWVAANQDRNRPGRAWRPLVDTAIDVQTLNGAPTAWQSYRRALDYYDESLLVWLDADATIRRSTNGRKSLDDFVRAFFGGTSSAPMVRPYTLDDIVTALDAVAPNDWRAFFRERVYTVQPHPPLGALDASGWRLVYNDTPNEWMTLRERSFANTDLTFPIGITVKGGAITDVTYGSPAFAAGIVPGMKVISINGRNWSADAAREELRAGKTMDVVVQYGTDTMTVHVAHSGSDSFPHLERIEGTADLFGEIVRPRAISRN